MMQPLNENTIALQVSGQCETSTSAADALLEYMSTCAVDVTTCTYTIRHDSVRAHVMKFLMICTDFDIFQIFNTFHN